MIQPDKMTFDPELVRNHARALLKMYTGQKVPQYERDKIGLNATDIDVYADKIQSIQSWGGLSYEEMEQALKNAKGPHTQEMLEALGRFKPKKE